jgi:hypothetical protein
MEKEKFPKHLLQTPTLRGCSSEIPPQYTLTVQVSYLIFIHNVNILSFGFTGWYFIRIFTSTFIAHLSYHSPHKGRKGKPEKQSSSFFWWTRIASIEHQLGVQHTEGRIIYPNDKEKYNGFIRLRKGTRGRLLCTCFFGFNKGKKYLD